MKPSSIFACSTNAKLAMACVFTVAVSSLIAAKTYAQDSPGWQPIPVTVQKTADGWRMLRAGQPYRVRGAGGEGPLAMLKSCGGNSNRLWGVDETTAARLDEAHQNGISVAVGIWLRHERHGFDYSDQAAVDQQFETVIAAVKKFKDHPAVLIWGIGNEMEGSGDNPLIWQHIEKLAHAIKEIDPLHPTMTVIAEMGGKKIPELHRLCPSLDIVGINSYGGAPSVPTRYRELGGTKPYLVTEFGPPGPWEIPKNHFDAAVEKTSTEKVAAYREAYSKFNADSELCLGCYAFLWGNKQEATATWFGLLLPDGKRTAGVDVLTELWSGSPVANHCPTIDELKLEGEDEVDPGSTIRLSLQAQDPEREKLNVRWVLMAEAKSYNTSGDFQKAPPSYEENIQAADEASATIQLPETPGLYRVYAYVEDGAQGAAVANLPVRVIDNTKSLELGAKVEIPFTLYDEPKTQVVYVPTGWMGSVDAISLDDKCQTNPKFGTYCIECNYSKASNWGGVVWQHPAGDWGEKPGGLNLTGAQKMTLWARGAEGEEEVKFGYGILGSDKKYFDTGKDEIGVKLSKEWKQYTFDLRTTDLTRIKSGFYWITAGQGRSLRFYLDRIVFE